MKDEEFQEKLEKIFLSESKEVIERIENCLLELEKNNNISHNTKEVLRATHTLKGSSGMIGSEQLPNFVHNYETVLKSILNNPQKPKNSFSFLLKQLDYIKFLIEKLIKNKEPIDLNEYQKNIENLKNFEKQEIIENNKEIEISDENSNEKFGFFDNKKEEKKSDVKKYYKIDIKIKEHRIEGTWYPEDLIYDLQKIGNIKKIKSYPDENIKWLNFDFNQLHLSFEILFESFYEKKSIEDVFIFFLHNNEISINEIPEFIFNNLILDDKGKKDNKKETIKDKKEIKEQKEDKNLKKSISIEEEIKIPASKIDKLIDIVGELIISNSNLANIQKKINDINLDQIQYNINKISRQLRDSILSLKMVPIGQLLTKYFRMIRDLSIEFKKEIFLHLEGEGTELDKGMFDTLQEPLLHLLRNSVDHGIELPEEREKLGKPREGKIIIRSYHENGQIVIEVEDDGRGLDRDKILKKGIEKGLLKENIEYTDEEIFKLIFESGFSTKDEVTLISGRGVGMDVVASGIKKLNGSIKINSIKGKGTKFIIHLPLTLAIIEGFLLRVGPNHFVIPLSYIGECFEVNFKELEKNNMVYNLRKEYLSVINLSQYFDNISYDNFENTHNKQVVVLVLGNNKLGIMIDEIIGNIQAVIKPLAKIIQKTHIITGSTLLGSGEVALIIDVPNLFDKFKEI